MLKKIKKLLLLFVQLNISALSAIKACNDLKIKIGQDISIITFDSLIVSNLITPQITSISFPVKELG